MHGKNGIFMKDYENEKDARREASKKYPEKDRRTSRRINLIIPSSALLLALNILLLIFLNIRQYVVTIQVPPPTSSQASQGVPTPSSSPSPIPTIVSTQSAQPAAPPETNSSGYLEQQGSHGVSTFSDPENATGTGPRIPAMAYVVVSCRVYAPEIPSANPDGWWYRIASAPWNNAYYSPANTFWNGDIPGNLPYTHNTDFNVPVC
jgi:hypothetical protein